MKALGNFSDYNVDIVHAKEVKGKLIYKQVDHTLFIKGEIGKLDIKEDVADDLKTISNMINEIVLSK